MMDTQRQLEEWRKELRTIDPYLDLVRAKDSAEGVPGLKPGYYHVIRHNPGAPTSLMAIETEDGGFKEPDSSVFDMLRRSDFWNDELQRDRRRKLERARESENRRKEREAQARKDEYQINLKALESPGVLFGSKRWTNRAGARQPTAPGG